MCGVLGFWGVGDVDDLASMSNGLRHRGPDASGTYLDESQALFLGHRRLSIRDVKGGSQPMITVERDLVVVFNGEIYNHAELRLELEQRGHIFQSDHSDTEVLLHGFREWGETLPERLNGMFAFALWDVRCKSLFLARDRFGEKPLFWGLSGDLFCFGSELSVFSNHSRFVTSLDRKSLKKLLAYGFIPAPSTIYTECNKLPAGHWMWVREEGRKIQQSCYWSYQIAPRDEQFTNTSEEALAIELRELLTQSVSRRMVSDVPLGVFLSGGIDSSAIAVLAASLSDRPLDTFSMGFREASYDEREFAKIVAKQIGSNHHEQIVDLEVLKSVGQEVLTRLDEPMSDPSIIPTYALSRMTASKVKVALSGDGGDELFAGYDTFAALKIARIFENYIPESVRKGAASLAGLLPRSSNNVSLEFKIRRALGGIGHGSGCWNPLWMAPLYPDMIADLLGEETHAEELYEDAIRHWDGCASTDLVDRSSEYFVRFYLQDDILTKVDRAAMLNSLETRAVFLDNDLVEFCRKLPAKLKLKGSERKYILKRALQGELPDEILYRKKKGFGIPVVDWVNELPMNDAVLATIGANESAMREWQKLHWDKKGDYRFALWQWYVLGLSPSVVSVS
ncbi:MAG: asparagine synthase (glutamine-hydrolyzing) [Rhodospirillales bacterium]|nr:asparagine synthase (glutamine-hydrolyzing) [Rhodospirillales bacterium]